MLARKIKLKINKTKQEEIINLSLDCGNIYNILLQYIFDRIDSGNKILSHFDLINYCRNNQIGNEVGSDVIGEICKRLSITINNWQESQRIKLRFWLEYGEGYKKPLQNFLKKQGKKLWGKPRFKKKGISIQFHVRKTDQKRVKVFGSQTSINIPLIGKIKGRNDRQEIIGNVKLVSINIDNCKDFWATIICDGEAIKKEITSRNEGIGVDLGLKHTVTAANDFEIIQPERDRFLDKQMESIKNASREKRRDLPFIHRKIARRRKHSHHVMAKELLKAANNIYVGNLNSRFLFGGKLARSASDAAHSQFLSILSYKAENAGKIVTIVNEAYTSMTCYKCGKRQKMELWERQYDCPCGYSNNRDVNAALNILSVGERQRLGVT